MCPQTLSADMTRLNLTKKADYSNAMKSSLKIGVKKIHRGDASVVYLGMFLMTVGLAMSN